MQTFENFCFFCLRKLGRISQRSDDPVSLRRVLPYQYVRLEEEEEKKKEEKEEEAEEEEEEERKRKRKRKRRRRGGGKTEMRACKGGGKGSKR